MAIISEILKIIPLLDAATAEKLEKQLSNRFNRIAKRFGASLKNHTYNMVSGGLKGIAMGLGMNLFDKLVSPLKETEETIKRLLKESDDIVTDAARFETTAGKLFKLQQIALSAGMDYETLQTMLQKFQLALAEARAGKEETLKEFVGETDIVDAFYKFQLSLKKLPADMRVLFQSKIFGERIYGRAAEFFQTDLMLREQEIKARPSQYYEKLFEKTAGLENLQAILQAQRNLEYLPQQQELLNKHMIIQMDKAEREREEQTISNLKGYEELKNVGIAFNEMNTKITEIFNNLSKSLPTIIDYLKSISNSRLVKGLGSVFKRE